MYVYAVGYKGKATGICIRSGVISEGGDNSLSHQLGKRPPSQNLTGEGWWVQNGELSFSWT